MLRGSHINQTCHLFKGREKNAQSLSIRFSLSITLSSSGTVLRFTLYEQTHYLVMEKTIDFPFRLVSAFFSFRKLRTVKKLSCKLKVMHFHPYEGNETQITLAEYLSSCTRSFCSSIHTQLTLTGCSTVSNLFSVLHAYAIKYRKIPPTQSIFQPKSRKELIPV